MSSTGRVEGSLCFYGSWNLMNDFNLNKLVLAFGSVGLVTGDTLGIISAGLDRFEYA